MAIEKKRIITSYSRLSEELEELFQETYPKGYSHAVISITKPNGETFYAVRLETEEASYLVKVEVNIGNEDEDDDDSDEGYEREGEDIEGSDQYGDEEESDSNASYASYDL